jgi:glutamate synthase domain-containing protein 1
MRVALPSSRGSTRSRCTRPIRRALDALANLEHRGAAGADASTGDGAGILMQIRMRSSALSSRTTFPQRAGTAWRCASSPTRAERRHELEQLLMATVEDEGQSVVCWRDVPVDAAFAGRTASAAAPLVRQLVVAPRLTLADQDAFERKLYVIRRRFELEGGADAIIPSFSSRTIVYKGMLTAPQLRGYYPDLQDERTASALALVHSRFSTNTFPSWELAHPYRMIAHNGEINTVRGNINWMRARESQLASELFGDDLHKVLPLVREGGSDSAVFDNVLELLVLGGRSLPTR